MKKIFQILLVFSLAAVRGLGNGEGKVVRLEFVDSNHQRISYFIFQFWDINKNDTIISNNKYIDYSRSSIYSELLPTNPVGAGINIDTNSNIPSFKAEIDIDWIKQYETTLNAPEVKDHQHRTTDKTKLYYYIFLDGTIRTFGKPDLEKLGPGKHEILIPGNMGSGKWSELGDFLVDSACYWRQGRGDRKALLLKCDLLLQQYFKEGNLTWAGNLTFVRAFWLRGNIKHLGVFGSQPSKVTSLEWQELPWGQKGFFGNESAVPFGQPIEPFRAFKQVLEVNPGDPRSIYWVKVLPYISGAKIDSPDFIFAYLEQTKRLFETYKDQLDDKHRVECIDKIIEFIGSSVFVQWYWKKKTNFRLTDAQVDWILSECKPLISNYPFLSEMKLTRWESLIRYVKDASMVHMPRQ